MIGQQFCVSALLSFVLLFHSVQIRSQDRPNVVLILADDQGWGDVAVHGNNVIRTPVLDQLAARGAQLKNFYVSPLCAPTRASLLTGKYYLRTGTTWVSKGKEDMNSSEVTIAELMKKEGYITGCFGKWHNGSNFPRNAVGQGFDEFLGFSGGHLNNYFDAELEHNGKLVTTKGYVTDVLTDAAINFIDKNKSRPFFCYIPYNAPHSPHQVPQEYFKFYEREGLSPEVASIYGMCENMDTNIGRIVKKLELLGLTNNTIVIFLSDNGPNGIRYNSDLRGIKGSIHEGGMKVPCFIKWPSKIPAGSTISSISGHIDILPTLAEFCSLRKPVSIDGLSLRSQLLGKSTNWSFDRSLFEIWPSQSISSSKGTVRTEKFRLVIEESDTLLFDMEQDPVEKNNIAKANKKIKDELVNRYTKWCEQVISTNDISLDIPIGYEEAAQVRLLAPEAKISGKIFFKEGHGWANDWLTNWVTPEDSIFWNIDVVESVKYQITLLYSMPQETSGLSIFMSTLKQKTSPKAIAAFNSALKPSPDRVRRKEAYEQSWGELDLGTINLEPGKQSLSLRAIHASDFYPIEIKEIRLTKQ